MRQRHLARGALWAFLLLASPFVIDCSGGGLSQRRDDERVNVDLVEVASQKKEPEESQG